MRRPTTRTNGTDLLLQKRLNKGETFTIGPWDLVIVSE
jgi:hypothetical protein